MACDWRGRPLFSNFLSRKFLIVKPEYFVASLATKPINFDNTFETLLDKFCPYSLPVLA